MIDIETRDTRIFRHVFSWQTGLLGQVAFHSDPLVPVFKGLDPVLSDSTLDRQREKYLKSTQRC
jgi:hypothetical protein